MKISQRLVKIIQDFFQRSLDLLKIALTPHQLCVLVCNFDLSKFFAFFEV